MEFELTRTQVRAKGIWGRWWSIYIIIDRVLSLVCLVRARLVLLRLFRSHQALLFPIYKPARFSQIQSCSSSRLVQYHRPFPALFFKVAASWWFNVRWRFWVGDSTIFRWNFKGQLTLFENSRSYFFFSRVRGIIWEISRLSSLAELIIRAKMGQISSRKAKWTRVHAEDWRQYPKNGL